MAHWGNTCFDWKDYTQIRGSLRERWSLSWERDHRRSSREQCVVIWQRAAFAPVSVGDSLIVVGENAFAAAGAEVDDDVVVRGGLKPAGCFSDGQHCRDRSRDGRGWKRLSGITQGVFGGVRSCQTSLVLDIVAMFFLVT